MTRVLLLGPAREAAGVRHDEIAGDTVADVLTAARERYGTPFDEILATSQIWLNGEPVDVHTGVGPQDEIAVLPPVSGG